MTQTSQLSPELARSVLNVARALLVAVRNWTLYPPEHPTVASSVARLAEVIRQSSLGSVFSIGITPETLLVEGAPADTKQPAIAEAAALLHDRDLLQLTFLGDAPPAALHTLLRILTLDAHDRRERGGPAVIWAAEGHPSLALEQIDYARVLARDEGDVPEPARRDDVWRSIVMSIAGAQKAIFDERAQERLLAIAGSPPDISDLATAVAAPRCAPDGSPMITSQAAAVLAAFRHLTSIVSVAAPERMPEVMNNIATASLQLDPHVMMEVLQNEDEPAASVAVVRGVAGAFDDMKVAQLLATALALDGQASDRLATIFNTIAPDEDRKRRVMTLTKSLLSESDFGKGGQFETLWSSMEELLVAYNDKPFVSEAYRTALDGVGGRAERMAMVDMPGEHREWMESLGQDNVRRLSVQMLIDLMTIETDATRAAEIAEDMEALGEDLLMAGAYDDARAVTAAMAERATSATAVGREACRHALGRLGESLAMRETVAILGDIDEAGWNVVRTVMRTTGPSIVDALTTLVAVEHDTPGSARAAELIVAFGKPSVSRLGGLVGDSRWVAQRAGARLLGAIASADGVPLLQPLLRKGDPRVTREAVTALSRIDDPSAARAIQTVLRASSGATRQAVIDALVADRDERVVPMLVRVIGESDSFGKDYEVVLETMEALATVGSDQATPALVSVARQRRWYARRKTRALKEKAVDGLARIGGPNALQAIDEAGRTGDRLLQKIVQQRRPAAARAERRAVGDAGA